MTCSKCGETIARANGIFVHAATGRPESLNSGHHYATVAATATQRA